MGSRWPARIVARLSARLTALRRCLRPSLFLALSVSERSRQFILGGFGAYPCPLQPWSLEWASEFWRRHSLRRDRQQDDGPVRGRGAGPQAVVHCLLIPPQACSTTFGTLPASIRGHAVRILAAGAPLHPAADFKIGRHPSRPRPQFPAFPACSACQRRISKCDFLARACQ